MRVLKAKIAILLVVLVFLFFFSNDFGLINVENTAIITAIAVDGEKDEYSVTAQIAVPEATNTTTENKLSVVSGTGNTVGSAIKNIGDLTGWFPKLDFCNLIVIGKEIAKDNVIKVLDYFSKTLRIQDSAVVVLSEEKAKDLLEASTPLDNISSFALQKVLLKTTGFDRDVVESNIKAFVTGYYSVNSSSMMPIVKIKKQESKSAGQPDEGNSEGGEKGGDSSDIFDAKTTALFLEGFKVGELDDNLTLAFNMINGDFSGTTLELNDVPSPVDVSHNYLLTVKKCKPKITVKATENDLTLNITLKLYCKVSDQNAIKSDVMDSKNKALPEEVVMKTETMILGWIDGLINIEKDTGCDFLKIKEKLYRNNHKYYGKYKDDFLSDLKVNVKVAVSGQK